MGWLSRPSAGARALEDAATERLERLAQQWRPLGAEEASPVHDLVSETSDPWLNVSAADDEPKSVRTGPWTPAAVRALVVLLAACLAVTGWWWWSGRPHEVTSTPEVVASGPPLDASQQPALVVSTPTQPAPDVVVHVTGQVAHPGLVTLPAGSRVSDAVLAAGGVTRRRAADTVNLARVVVDGEQIVVGGTAVAVPAAVPSATPQVLDLNVADSTALQGLPGVGPVLAGRIIEWRMANGAFRSVDELGEVSGIGDATLVRLRPLVRV